MQRGAATVPVRPGRSLQSISPILVGPDALRWHAAAFAGGAVVLTLLNVLRSPDRLWFWAPLLVWCGLLAAHACLIARGRAAPAVTSASAVVVAPALAPATTAAAAAPVAAPVAAAPQATTSATPDPAPTAPPPNRMPAAAELAALRLSLDPWATGALAGTGAGQEELPESVLALWRLTPEPPATLAAEAAPPRPSVDLHALGWI